MACALQAFERLGYFIKVDDMLTAHATGTVDGNYVVPPNSLINAGIEATAKDMLQHGNYGVRTVLAEGAGKTGMGAKLRESLRTSMLYSHTLEANGRAMRLLRRLAGADPDAVYLHETTFDFMWAKPGDMGGSKCTLIGVKKSDTTYVCGKDSGTESAKLRTQVSHCSWAIFGILLRGLRGGSYNLSFVDSPLAKLSGGAVSPAILRQFSAATCVGKFYENTTIFAAQGGIWDWAYYTYPLLERALQSDLTTPESEAWARLNRPLGENGGFGGWEEIVLRRAQRYSGSLARLTIGKDGKATHALKEVAKALEAAGMAGSLASPQLEHDLRTLQAASMLRAAPARRRPRTPRSCPIRLSSRPRAAAQEKVTACSHGRFKLWRNGTLLVTLGRCGDGTHAKAEGTRLLAALTVAEREARRTPIHMRSALRTGSSSSRAHGTCTAPLTPVPHVNATGAALYSQIQPLA